MLVKSKSNWQSHKWRFNLYDKQLMQKLKRKIELPLFYLMYLQYLLLEIKLTLVKNTKHLKACVSFSKYFYHCHAYFIVVRIG